MRSAMNRFYDTNAKAYRLIYGDSYDGRTTKELISEFLCDIQPVSGDLSELQDGIRAMRKMKMYFDNENLAVGDYIEAKGEGYIITRIENRSLGGLAYLKGCELYED